MGDEIKLKKFSKLLSILLMVALLVTINFDAYASSRSGGFKSSSHSSSSSSSSSGSSSGGFKSSSSYSKPSSTTKSTPSSANNSTSPSTSNVNRSSNNSSFMPMIFFGNSMGSSIFRYLGLFVIILVIYFVYKASKRKK